MQVDRLRWIETLVYKANGDIRSFQEWLHRRFLTVRRTPKRPRGEEAGIREALALAEELQRKVQALYEASGKVEEHSRKDDNLDYSERHMALHQAKIVGLAVHNLRKALDASLHQDGHWYTLEDREKRAVAAEAQANLAVFEELR